jgi:hypothetical protein
MEDLLGFVFELILEVLIQVLFEGGIAAASRARDREGDASSPSRSHRGFRLAPFLRATLSRANPPLTILKFTVLGLGLGFISVLILPHPLLHPSKLHGISLLVSPVITGTIMALIGRAVRRRGSAPVRIESFTYGFTFAFAMSLIRLLMVH